jgi:hypothetical protein
VIVSSAGRHGSKDLYKPIGYWTERFKGLDEKRPACVLRVFVVNIFGIATQVFSPHLSAGRQACLCFFGFEGEFALGNAGRT